MDKNKIITEMEAALGTVNVQLALLHTQLELVEQALVDGEWKGINVASPAYNLQSGIERLIHLQLQAGEVDASE